MYTPVWLLSIKTYYITISGARKKNIVSVSNSAIQFNPENSTDAAKVEKIMTILNRNVTFHSENKNKE